MDPMVVALKKIALRRKTRRRWTATRINAPSSHVPRPVAPPHVRHPILPEFKDHAGHLIYIDGSVKERCTSDPDRSIYIHRLKDLFALPDEIWRETGKDQF